MEMHLKEINLFHKFKSWSPEKEYRFVLEGIDAYIPIEKFGLKVSAAYLGIGLGGPSNRYIEFTLDHY